MVKNEERVGVVQALGSNGEGIIKDEGSVVFVPFTLVGEKIKYKVLKVTSKCAYGKVLEVLTPAEMRVRPACAVFGKCGGCQLQHIKYMSQLKIKEENLLTEENSDLLSINYKSKNIDVTYFYEGSKEDESKKEEEIKKLEESIARREKLLSNENYVNKAPANIVELDRKKLEEEKEKLELLKNN